jgi:hypothetical protein
MANALQIYGKQNKKLFCWKIVGVWRYIAFFEKTE